MQSVLLYKIGAVFSTENIQSLYTVFLHSILEIWSANLLNKERIIQTFPLEVPKVWLEPSNVLW